MRSNSRVAQVSFNTVTKLLVDAGGACAEYHDKAVREVESRRIQCDEFCSFCYAKQHRVGELLKNALEGVGDVWTWTAIDANSKLIVSYLVGGRDAGYAN